MAGPGQVGGLVEAPETEPAAGSVAAVADATAHLVALQRANRAIKVNIGGAERYAAVEDAAASAQDAADRASSGDVPLWLVAVAGAAVALAVLGVVSLVSSRRRKG